MVCGKPTTASWFITARFVIAEAFEACKMNESVKRHAMSDLKFDEPAIVKTVGARRSRNLSKCSRQPVPSLHFICSSTLDQSSMTSIYSSSNHISYLVKAMKHKHSFLLSCTLIDMVSSSAQGIKQPLGEEQMQVKHGIYTTLLPL